MTTREEEEMQEEEEDEEEEVESSLRIANQMMADAGNCFEGDGYSEVKHVDARAIPGWVTYWEAAPELPETKPGFGGDRYSEVKHLDARAIPGWVTYWEAAPELPETKSKLCRKTSQNNNHNVLVIYLNLKIRHTCMNVLRYISHVRKNETLPMVYKDLAWLFRMEFFLGSQNLMGFVDGSTPCPPQFVRSSDGTTTHLSQDYVNWKVQDQNIGHMIGQTLSKLKSNLQNLRKGADDIETYLDKIKEARDALETVGVQVDDENIVVIERSFCRVYCN
ncbi:hypothetical protein ACLB2K_071133 [Fragaria x ananassa]